MKTKFPFSLLLLVIISCEKNIDKQNVVLESIHTNKSDIVLDYYFHSDTITIEAKGSWVAEAEYPPVPYLDRWMSLERIGSDSSKLVVSANNEIRQTMDRSAMIAIRHANSSDTTAIRIDVLRSAISKNVILFGGEGDDALNSIVIIGITSEAVAAGYSSSSTGDLSINKGGKDFWLLKLNYNGNKIWSRSFGGSNDDVATSVARSYSRVDMSSVHDGYIVAGYTLSNDGDVSGNHGGKDAWIVKTDTLGNLVWQKTFGGPGDDEILKISDGANPDLLFSGTKNGDQWMFLINESGDIVWENTFGSSGVDRSGDVREVEWGYAFTGSGTARDGDVADKPTSSEDAWIVRTNPDGSLLWKNYIAGDGEDRGVAVGATILYGNTRSRDIFPDFNGTQNIFIAEFDDNDGHLLSKKIINNSSFDELVALTGTRHNSSVILAGRSMIPGSNGTDDNSMEGLLLEIDNSGQVKSVHRTGGPQSIINAITPGGAGQSIFVGSSSYTDRFGNEGRSGWYGWIECP